MDSDLHGNLRNTSNESRFSPLVLVIGAVALLAIIAAVYWGSRYAPAPAKRAEIPLSMGPAETEYIPHLEFQGMQASRASNFLNQEVTLLFGTVKNNGTRGVRQVEVTLEFHDLFGQVVLRDKQRLFGEDAIPLEPTRMRDFEITYETLPAQWNQAYPTVTVTGLALE